jgi:hypothetical protein
MFVASNVEDGKDRDSGTRPVIPEKISPNERTGTTTEYIVMIATAMASW